MNFGEEVFDKTHHVITRNRLDFTNRLPSSSSSETTRTVTASDSKPFDLHE